MSEFEFNKSDIVHLTLDNSLKITNRLNQDQAENYYSIHPNGIKDIGFLSAYDSLVIHNEKSITIFAKNDFSKWEPVREQAGGSSSLFLTNLANETFLFLIDSRSLKCYDFQFKINTAIELNFEPNEIYYNNDNSLLYVCCRMNEEITVYKYENQSFKYVSVIKVGVPLTSILILGDIVFAKDNMNDDSWILNFKDFSVILQINHKLNQFSRIGNYVYEVSGNQKIYCYNSSGEVINEIDVKKFPNNKLSFTKLVRIENDDLLLLSNRRFFIKFKK